MHRNKLLHLFIIATILVSACAKESCPFIDERMCDRDFRDSINNLLPDTSDVIDIPDTGIVANGRVIFSAETLEEVPQKVLLEYFTGFRCANCPPASATAKNIKNNKSDDVVLVIYHATSTFAAPIAQPPAMYSTDMRTPEGEAYINAFPFQGLPSGMVNRKDYGVGQVEQAANWLDRIESELSSPADAFLRIRKASYNPVSYSVNLQLAYRVLAGATADYKLTVGAMEMGIIEAQKDGPNDIYPYTHDYVFRTNFNGTFGETLTEASPPLGPGETVLMEVVLNLNTAWDPNEIKLFAYLHHADTRVVIQAAEYALQP